MTVAFAEHVALIGQFLERRQHVVERIEGALLNVRGKDTSRRRDRQHLEQQLHACFFNAPGIPREAVRLKGQLAASHKADGFEAVQLAEHAHELDPLHLVLRAYDRWEHDRWPGRSGRLTYAETIYAAFVFRVLEYLSVRIWDDERDRAGDRLREIQRLLDRLNEPANSTVFVRDARWLIQTAQGPLTREVEPYFRVAGRICGSFTTSDRLEIHKAGATLAGGHLRSQLRHRARETGRTIDDPEVAAITRNSNSMDTALLVGDLVALLEAYRVACAEQDGEGRLELADAILQGMSADPELCLTRLDLLVPCTMLEELFIERDEAGRARYTPLGEAHVGLVGRYGELIGTLAEPLREDAATFDPSHHVYSPYGITYGFCADILLNMAVGALVAQPSHGLSLEDTFGSRGNLESKLARANGWQRLSRRRDEREPFDHSADWAGQMFRRLMRALDARALCPTAPNASTLPDARLFIASARDALPAGIVQAQEHFYTSDLTRALSTGATGCLKADFAADRREGRFLASAELDGTSVGVSKVVLSLLTSQGRDALMTGVPPAIVDVLHLTCPALVVPLA